MDLQYVKGFPTWEEGVFAALSSSFSDLLALFTYYAGDTPGMQQAELVDLAMDSNLPTKQYPITQIIGLFEQVNKESGVGDADLELFEFLQFLVTLAFSMDKDTTDYAASLSKLLAKLSRSKKVDELTPLLESDQRQLEHEEAAFIAPEVWTEVVIPLIEVKNTALVAISTPLDSSNFYSTLVTMKDERGEPIFHVLEARAACEKCIQTLDDPSKCPHVNLERPQWKSKEIHGHPEI